MVTGNYVVKTPLISRRPEVERVPARFDTAVERRQSGTLDSRARLFRDVLNVRKAPHVFVRFRYSGQRLNHCCSSIGWCSNRHPIQLRVSQTRGLCTRWAFVGRRLQFFEVRAGSDSHFAAQPSCRSDMIPRISNNTDTTSGSKTISCGKTIDANPGIRTRNVLRRPRVTCRRDDRCLGSGEQKHSRAFRVP